jgi:hypothetical protein
MSQCSHLDPWWRLPLGWWRSALPWPDAPAPLRPPAPARPRALQRFWRRSSAPLEAISERASSLELSRAGVDLEDGKVDEVKITIDLEADPAGEGALPLTPPPLPPLRAKPSVPPVPPLSLSLSLSPSRAAPRLVAGFSPVRPRQGAPVPGSPFSRSTAGGASPLRRQASGGSSMPSRHTPHPADVRMFRYCVLHATSRCLPAACALTAPPSCPLQHISAHVAPRARADSRGHVRSMVELENYIRKNALKVGAARSGGGQLRVHRGDAGTGAGTGVGGPGSDYFILSSRRSPSATPSTAWPTPR